MLENLYVKSALAYVGLGYLSASTLPLPFSFWDRVSLQQPRLASNSQISTGLCLLRAGIKGLCIYAWLKKTKTKTKTNFFFCIFKGKSKLHKIPTQHKVHEGISAANQKKTERSYHITLSEKIKSEIDEANGGIFPLITENVKQKAKNQEIADKSK